MPADHTPLSRVSGGGAGGAYAEDEGLPTASNAGALP